MNAMSQRNLEQPAQSPVREVPAVLTLLTLFLVALVLRLLNLWLAAQESPFFGSFTTDDRVYHEWALAISGGELSRGEPFFLCPLFAYLLGAVYAVFGPHPLAGQLLQVLLSSLTALLIASIGGVLYSRRAGVLAGVVAAAYGPLIFFSEILLTETLYLFLAVAALRLYLACRAHDRPLPWLACGLLCGLAAVTRTTFLLSSLLLGLWLVVERCPTPSRAGGATWRGLLRSTLGFGIGLALVVAVPAAHNATLGGDLVLVNSSGGVNFYMGNHEGAKGRYHVPAEIAVETVQNPRLMRETFRRLAEEEAGGPLKDSQVSAHYLAKGMAFIREHPGAWLRLSLLKLAQTFESFEFPGERNYYQACRYSSVLRWTPGRYPLVLGLALLGLFALRRRQLLAAVPLFLQIAAVLAVLLGFFVTDRFRLALVPYLAVLAGAGLEWLWRQLARRRWLPTLVGGVAVALLCLGSVALSVLLPGDRQTESYMSLHNLAEQLIRKERYQEAVENLERSLELEPGFLPARSNLALVLSQMPARRNEAVAQWRIVIELSRQKGLPLYEERARRWLRRLGVNPDR